MEFYAKFRTAALIALIKDEDLEMPQPPSRELLIKTIVEAESTGDEYSSPEECKEAYRYLIEGFEKDAEEKEQQAKRKEEWQEEVARREAAHRRRMEQLAREIREIKEGTLRISCPSPDPVLLSGESDTEVTKVLPNQCEIAAQQMAEGPVCKSAIEPDCESSGPLPSLQNSEENAKQKMESIVDKIRSGSPCIPKKRALQARKVPNITGQKKNLPPPRNKRSSSGSDTAHTLHHVKMREDAEERSESKDRFQLQKTEGRKALVKLFRAMAEDNSSRKVSEVILNIESASETRPTLVKLPEDTAKLQENYNSLKGQLQTEHREEKVVELCRDKSSTHSQVEGHEAPDFTGNPDQLYLDVRNVVLDTTESNDSEKNSAESEISGGQTEVMLGPQTDSEKCPEFSVGEDIEARERQEKSPDELAPKLKVLRMLNS